MTRDPRPKALVFTAQKTMYGGRHIAEGDTIFVFASENGEGRASLRDTVTFAAEPSLQEAWYRRANAMRKHNR